MGGRSRTSPERAPGRGVHARAADAPAHRRRRVEGGSESDELDAAIDEQRRRRAAPRGARVERARRLAHALEELHAQADDRRRTIDELNERLRQHEHAVTEQVDRAENETRTRIEVTFAEIERRQVEHLERAITREIDARSEAGAVEFENRMRAIREEAAQRSAKSSTAPRTASSAAPTVSSRPSSSRR